MREIIATLSSKGQLTVPIEVRQQLGLKAGDKIVFQVEGEEIKLIPATSRLQAGYRSIPALAPPKTWAEVKDIVAEERSEHHAQQSREGRA